VKPGARVALALLAVGGVALLRTGLASDAHRAARRASVALEALPAAPLPALLIGRPEPLRSDRYLSRWSIVRAPTAAHAEPRTASPIVTTLATVTPDETPNVLSVLGATSDASGQLWVRVRLPILPNGAVGWVRRLSLGAYQTVNTHLVVDRRRLLATLYRNGRPIFRAPVGVGTDFWPTPTGEFTVRSKLTRYASPFYGPIAFGTTARSAVLTDWPGGGFVGIHGTNSPRLIPGHISHGCIRMRNPDILRLAALMPVGTPLTIE
jgi:L,D-transpeptidase catalytic domain